MKLRRIITILLIITFTSNGLGYAELCHNSLAVRAAAGRGMTLEEAIFINSIGRGLNINQREDFREAAKEMLRLFKAEKTITAERLEIEFKKWHGILAKNFTGSQDAYGGFDAGDYRGGHKIDEKMPKVFAWIVENLMSDEVDKIELAVESFYRILMIHPFEDGNKRVLFILMNCIFLKSGSPFLFMTDEEQVELDRLTQYSEFDRDGIVNLIRRINRGASREPINAGEALQETLEPEPTVAAAPGA